MRIKGSMSNHTVKSRKVVWRNGRDDTVLGTVGYRQTSFAAHKLAKQAGLIAGVDYRTVDIATVGGESVWLLKR